MYVIKLKCRHLSGDRWVRLFGKFPTETVILAKAHTWERYGQARAWLAKHPGYMTGDWSAEVQCLPR